METLEFTRPEEELINPREKNIELLGRIKSQEDTIAQKDKIISELKRFTDELKGSSTDSKFRRRVLSDLDLFPGIINTENPGIEYVEKSEELKLHSYLKSRLNTMGIFSGNILYEVIQDLLKKMEGLDIILYYDFTTKRYILKYSEERRRLYLKIGYIDGYKRNMLSIHSYTSTGFEQKLKNTLINYVGKVYLTTCRNDIVENEVIENQMRSHNKVFEIHNQMDIDFQLVLLKYYTALHESSNAMKTLNRFLGTQREPIQMEIKVLENNTRSITVSKLNTANNLLTIYIDKMGNSI